jgi:cytochrome bd-type quinol oxidase subunit 2
MPSPGPLAFIFSLYAVAVICVWGTLFIRRTDPEEATERGITVGIRKLDILALLPVVCVLLLVIWTFSVYRFSSYDDRWAIWPALLICPVFVATHIVLLVRRRLRFNYWAYAGLHVAFFFLIWIYSLMLISKDSL